MRSEQCPLMALGNALRELDFAVTAFDQGIQINGLTCGLYLGSRTVGEAVRQPLGAIADVLKAWLDLPPENTVLHEYEDGPLRPQQVRFTIPTLLDQAMPPRDELAMIEPFITVQEPRPRADA